MKKKIKQWFTYLFILVAVCIFSYTTSNDTVFAAEIVDSPTYLNGITLTNGQNSLLINGELVHVGDSGEGWIYKEADLLQLTGGSSIHSILVTDTMADIKHTIGSRNFTIEITGTNTITSTSDKNKVIELVYGTNAAGDNISAMISNTWGIMIYGNLTLTGKGELNLATTSANSISHFIIAFGNVTQNGPTIVADMKNISDYNHVIAATGFSERDNTQQGAYSFKKGILVIKNVGSSEYSALYALDGMSVSKGTIIKSGKALSSAKKVTLKKFWNLSEWDYLVGPNPAAYKYIRIASATSIKVGKPIVSSIKSTASGKLSIAFSETVEADGYEIWYSTSSKFTISKTNVLSTAKTNETISSLQKGILYYIKVKAYVLDEDGKKIFSAYSTVKRIKILN